MKLNFPAQKIFWYEQSFTGLVKNKNRPNESPMKKHRAIWIILLALTACVCRLPTPEATFVQIKVENDGGSIAAANPSQFDYDPYFSRVNDVPHFQISDASPLLK